MNVNKYQYNNKFTTDINRKQQQSQPTAKQLFTPRSYQRHAHFKHFSRTKHHSKSMSYIGISHFDKYSKFYKMLKILMKGILDLNVIITNVTKIFHNHVVKNSNTFKALKNNQFIFTQHTCKIFKAKSHPVCKQTNISLKGTISLNHSLH